jgi:hypothetical protein
MRFGIHAWKCSHVLGSKDWNNLHISTFSCFIEVIN